MYKTLHKKQGSVTVQLRFARSSVTFCAKRDNKKIYEEERMVTYSSLSYKIMLWKGRDERNWFEFYPFPENLKNSLELLADP